MSKVATLENEIAELRSREKMLRSTIVNMEEENNQLSSRVVR